MSNNYFTQGERIVSGVQGSERDVIFNYWAARGERQLFLKERTQSGLKNY